MSTKVSCRIVFTLAIVLINSAGQTSSGQQLQRSNGNNSVNQVPVVRDHRQTGNGGNNQGAIVRDHRKPISGGNGGVPPNGGGGGSPGGYAGPFNGATRIDVAKAGLTTLSYQYNQAERMDLRNTLDTAWLVIRGMLKNELMSLKSVGGRKIYDLNIIMADGGQAQPLLTVAPDGQSMTLKYRVPGNKMRFKAEVNNFFDPTIRVETTITLSITLRPSGNSQQPLRVVNSSIEFGNTKASVDGNIIFDAAKKLVEFIKGSDFERSIVQMVNGRKQDITTEASKGLIAINNKLRSHAMAGANVLTFHFDRPRHELVMRLSFPQMVATAN